MPSPGFLNSYQREFPSGLEELIGGKLHFSVLDKYARFLLDHKLEEMITAQRRLSIELKVPVLRYFTDVPAERVQEIGRKNMQELLTAFAENRAADSIRKSVGDWMAGRLPELSRNQISPEDISLISFIRIKVFRDLLPFYTADIKLALQIMEELTLYTAISETLAFRTLLTIQSELYEQAQEIAHIGNWSMDLKTHAIEWSSELFKIYEMEPQKLLDYDLRSFNHPDDDAYVQEQMKISRETGQPHDFFYRIILKNGKEKYLHARGNVAFDQEGHPEKFYGTLQDVTIQKKIERKHRENENFIQKVTELIPSIVSVYNVHTGEFLFVNNAVQSLLGYSPEMVYQKGIQFFMEIMHPDDLPRILAENHLAIENTNGKEGLRSKDEIREFRHRTKHANGQYRWFHTFGTPFERNAENGIESVINVSIDITEVINSTSSLHRTEEAIRQQEDRYYKMIDEVKDYAILLLSPEGIVENWNSGAESIKGYKAEEIVGKHFRIFYPLQDRETNLPERLIGEAVAKGKASHEGWRLRKDNTRFWGSVVITALHDRNGGIVGFTKVTRDLTERKLAEDNMKLYTANLELKNQELEQKNKELESFGYIASHDLQEPIRKIRIWTNKIEETEEISEGVKDALARIEKSCVRMQKLIQGILQYSQADMQQVPMERADLNVVLDEVLSDYSDQLEEKGFIIEREKLPVLKVARLQFVQLFSNLVSNAIKYSRTDIVPLIRFRCSREMAKEGVYYRILIEDNGIGFSQDQADRIFELFRRLDTGRSYTGTGIGLAICKKIVKNHGGTIEARGIQGSGASFEIRIPER